MKKTDNYYLSLEEPNRSCMLVLRDIILKQDEHIMETQKWGMPCFCYEKRMFCFLSVDSKTKEPYILIVEGWRINNPFLESAGRKRMKHLSINANEDWSIEIIEEVLNEALDLYRNGIIKGL